ncbi:MAG TPA: ArsA family ATPase, partial [Pyrinomonadaceae bacterium]|nr:ArsA family ATPase [Pyrinomonadaceae bacterium]
ADEVDLFLRDLSERIEAVRSMLFDPARASFVLVTIPEAMAFEESARYFKSLREEGVPVTDLVVNRVEQEHAGCPFCRARASMQTPWLDALGREFESLRRHYIPLFPNEVRGPRALREFARVAWGKAKDEGGRMKDERKAVEDSSSTRPSSFILHPSSFPLAPKRLVIFGGKGGVGKTTAAAAYALALAAAKPESRVLLFSTDPAHSLSDSFGERVGEMKRCVAGVANLDAREVDPAARFEELKERYRRWTDELFDSLGGGSRFEVKFDREAMRELVSLAPPGMDEIAALSAVSDLIDAGEYSTIVLDTAPTGHLLRFLELPEVALAWVRTFIKLLLKYRNVVRWNGVAEELVALSKSIKRVAALMSDAAACEFAGVAIPERMSLEETLRLAESLKRLKVPMRSLLVNNVVTREAAGGCDFCAARRRAQRRVIEEFRRAFPEGVEIYTAPQHAAEVRGRASLEAHFGSWRELD